MRTFFLLFLVSIIAQAQNATAYVNHRNEKHLCGVFELQELEKDSLYSSWYEDNYTAIDVDVLDTNTFWANNLESSRVDIIWGLGVGIARSGSPALFVCGMI